MDISVRAQALTCPLFYHSNYLSFDLLATL